MLDILMDVSCQSSIATVSIPALLEPRVFNTCLPGSCLFAHLLKTQVTEKLLFFEYFCFRINLQLPPQAMDCLLLLNS